MGAEQFFNHSSGENLEVTFQRVREQALYDHGHAGYSGTIAEKNEVSLRGTVDTYDMAKMFAENDLEKHDHDKWGPAWAVRITSDPKGFIFYGYASS